MASSAGPPHPAESQEPLPGRTHQRSHGGAPGRRELAELSRRAGQGGSAVSVTLSLSTHCPSLRSARTPEAEQQKGLARVRGTVKMYVNRKKLFCFPQT